MAKIAMANDRITYYTARSRPRTIAWPFQEAGLSRGPLQTFTLIGIALGALLTLTSLGLSLTQDFQPELAKPQPTAKAYAFGLFYKMCALAVLLVVGLNRVRCRVKSNLIAWSYLALAAVVSLNWLLSPKPYLDTGVDRFNYWGQSTFPGLEPILGTALLPMLVLLALSGSRYLIPIHLLLLLAIGNKYSALIVTAIVLEQFYNLSPTVMWRETRSPQRIRIMIAIILIVAGGVMVGVNQYENTPVSFTQRASYQMETDALLSGEARLLGNAGCEIGFWGAEYAIRTCFGGIGESAARARGTVIAVSLPAMVAYLFGHAVAVPAGILFTFGVRVAEHMARRWHLLAFAAWRFILVTRITAFMSVSRTEAILPFVP